MIANVMRNFSESNSSVPPNYINGKQLQVLRPQQGEDHIAPVHQLKAPPRSGFATAQVPRNKTGLPDRLKAGVENLSGYSLDNVKVHYNSPKPSQLQALAYTQGTDIHVAPGQEKHLPHETWHVVQQMQGKVKPTMQMKGVQINDDAGLEREADVMGEKIQTHQLESQGGQELVAHKLTNVVQQSVGWERTQRDNHAIETQTNTSDNNVIQRAYKRQQYRISAGKTRQIYVENGEFNLQRDEPIINRGVMYETMVIAGNGNQLANRYKQETQQFNASVGLSVAINDSFQKPDEIDQKQKNLTAIARNMKKQSPSINVVRVLWQDGRENLQESIRGEVPFAELRKQAAVDTGAVNLYADLQRRSQGRTWRRVGDDDMQFLDPNQNSDVNTKLEESEENAPGGAMLTFNYQLIPNSQDQFIDRICKAIYRAEGQVVQYVSTELGKQTYAIEPTTYYRGETEGPDPGAAWNQYEEFASSGQKQIKEGASLAKSLRKNYGIKNQFESLKEPMPTSHGGRLNEVVNLLAETLNAQTEPNIAQFNERFIAAIKAVDQSIWDQETLQRGAKWMAVNEEEKNSIDILNDEINKKIQEVLNKLIKAVGKQISTEWKNRNA
ncbi:MAG: DUF4157 domain-containing protein [Okeania sp. SIO3I5]|nr:DUF4157 domain-containing protein [Okeania sp. SIO3I5]